ncbi:phage tail tape measure protein [Streptomyces sp. NPDC101249]|uniref:phage tail tape measure protein n=1 Tax=Streptomyces sp. NPDC101249 TaxID=3366140 RepID=UPI0037FB4680
MSGFGTSLRQQIGEPVARASQSAGESGGESLMSGMKAKAAAGALAVGATVGVLVTKGLETSFAKGKASATLKAQLDISPADAKKAGEVAGKLWANSVTESVEEGAEAVKLVLGTGLVDSKASVKEIGKISTAVSDLATLFDQDITMVTKAASSMVKTAFAKDGTEAVDAMTWGFKNLGVKAEDLAETFNEYSPFLHNFGLSVKDSLGLMSQGLEAGAWDTDKIGDAFKEFYLRATGGADSVKDALKSIGVDAGGLMKAVAGGGPGARKALDSVLDALRKVPDETTKAQAVQNLFGGPGEDLGAAIFSLNVDTAATSVGNFAGAAKRAGADLRSDVGTQFETFKRKSLMAIGDAAGKYVLPKLMDFGRVLHHDVLPAVVTGSKWLGDNFGPAVKATGRAVGGTVRWFREWGIWLAPLAVLIGGITLALSAQAIVEASVIGIMTAYSLASRGITVVTQGWAAAQALLNTVMSLNPFVLAAIAIAALGVALVIAWKRSETFRNIVLGVWSAIQTGASWLWTNGIKPLVDGFMTGLRAVGTAASWLWTNVLSPTFSVIATAGKILATILTIVVFGPVYLYIKLVGAVFGWLWSAAIKPVFGWIAVGAKLWWMGVKLYGSAVMSVLRAAGAVFLWLWHTAAEPVIGWIVGAAKLWWMGVKLYGSAVMSLLRAVGGVFLWLWRSGAQPAFRSIGAGATWLYDKGIKPPIDKAKALANSLGTAFKAGANAVGKAMDSIKDKAKKPVAFVIDTVYNRGIRKVWNMVASKFGAPQIGEFKGFARGGVLPGQSSYKAGDSHLVPMRLGEGVAVSEAMRDPYERARLLAVNKAAMQGRSLAPFQGEGFARGGIFGWVSSAASKGADFVKEGVSWLKDGVKASAMAGLNNIVQPLIAKISGSASAYRDMVTGIPKRMIKEILGYSGKADAKLEASGFNKGFAGGLKWARTQAGKKYQWGGNGNPSWDCSGFVSAIESVIRGQSPHRRWATGAFSGATAPPGWVLNKRSAYQIGITNSGVGHTAGTINGVNVESRGGDGVVVGSRARSWRDSLFTHHYGFAAKGYADGTRGAAPGWAWVGERGPELVNFKGGEDVLNHRDSMAAWAAGGAGLDGYAKGTTKASLRARTAARKDIPGDLASFTKSLTGSASDISKAAKELTKDLAAAGIGGKSLTKSVTAASLKLQAMAKQRDAISERIKEAKQTAADQKKTAADYMSLSNLTDATSIGDVLAGMQARQDTVAASEAQIKTLKKKGLSRDLITQLIGMGPDNQLTGLLAGAGAGQIKQFNALAKAGGKLSASYGTAMTNAMYLAGNDGAKGFVAGLLAEEKRIQAAMARVGAGAVKAIRSKKGIDAHSPSRKGARAGADLGAGLVAGMAAQGPAVAAAAAQMGAAAVPAGVVPVTSSAAAQGAAGSLIGQRLYLVLDDGTELSGYVDDRVDGALTDVRRAKRSGKKGS